jgi:aspartate aminotransferase-like enzyme
VPKQLLFIPGPVTCPPVVLSALAKPMIDHRGPEYAKVLNRIAFGMQAIFGTANEVVLLGCSGTGGLEAAVANLFGPGDTVLACPVGVFGERLIAIARSYGITVEVLPTEWGHGVDPAALAARLQADTEKKIAGIMLTHNETSTGVQNEMGPLAAATRAHGALTIVDSVSGLGASEFTMDEWGFDVVVTASQKALAVPPGIAMVAVSERAWQRMDGPHAPSYYLDLRKAREFAKLGQTPWTPPVSIAYGLEAALNLYEDEGRHNVWERHSRNAQAVRAAARAMGLELFSQDGAHSVTVVAIKNPPGIDGDAIRKYLREERGYVLGGGQKDLKGTIIRIGTMGDLKQADFVNMLEALEHQLRKAGHEIPASAAVKAARAAFKAEAIPA